MPVLRKRFRVLLLAAIVAACAVPVGFALSLETPTATPAPVASHTVATVLVGTNGPSVTSWTALTGLQPVPDAAKLLFVGSMLFGLAAAVRKAV
jgi:hypothetical protein